MPPNDPDPSDGRPCVEPGLFHVVSVVQFLAVDWEPMQSEATHRHDFHQLRLWIEGESLAQLEDRRFEVRPGDIIYTPAGVDHRMESLSGAPWASRYLLISFHVESLGLETSANEGALRWHFPGALLDKQMRDCIRRMIGEYQNAKALCHEILVRAYLAELLVYLLRAETHQADGASTAKPAGALNDLASVWEGRFIEQVLNQMSTTYHRSMTIPEIAERHAPPIFGAAAITICRSRGVNATRVVMYEIGRLGCQSIGGSVSFNLKSFTKYKPSLQTNRKRIKKRLRANGYASEEHSLEVAVWP